MAGGYIAIVLSESSVNIANNTSVVTANVYYYGNGVSWSNYQCSGGITIDGTPYSFSHTFTTSSGAQWLGSASKTVSHNADGSRSVSASAWFATGVSIGTLTTSTSKTLTTIPRATTPTLSPNPVVAGNAVTIGTPRASSSFTHTLSYSIGAASGTIATGVGTSYAWTVPIDLISQITNSTSGGCTITCKTYNGSSLIGTKTATLNIEVPTSIVPSINQISIAEAVATVTSAFGSRYVQSLSQLNVSIDAAGAYESTVKAYSATLDGVNYIAQAFTSNLINASGNITLSVKVTDSRGRVAGTSRIIKIVPYTQPVITKMTYYQCNADGTQNSSGTCTKIIIAGKVSSVEEQNSKSLKLKYKAMSAETYTERTVTVSQWVFDTFVIISNTDPTVTYEYIATLIDKIGSTPSKIVTGVPVISRLAGGKGVTLFKEAEYPGFWVGNIDYTCTDEEYNELLEILGGGSS